jgi:hypothetical protein
VSISLITADKQQLGKPVMAPNSGRRRPRAASSPSPASDSESDSSPDDEKTIFESHDEPKFSDGSEPARKRRLLGEKLKPSAAGGKHPPPSTRRLLRYLSQPLVFKTRKQESFH